jgi:hypothetical protein
VFSRQPLSAWHASGKSYSTAKSVSGRTDYSFSAAIQLVATVIGACAKASSSGSFSRNR